MNRGIAVAGNIIADKVKTIDAFPEKGMLVSIQSSTTAVGGCVPNTAIDLAVIDGGLPVRALGRVGRDGEGELIRAEMQARGVNVDGVLCDETLPTAYTDVMTLAGSGERTFFHARGANSAFCLKDIDVAALSCDIFHAGYILLLDKLDAPDGQYGTKLARLLAEVQKRGIKTSIDCVSESGARFMRVVTPALKYCDYAVINEVEAGLIAGIAPRGGKGEIDKGNIKRILEHFFVCGVREKAIVHCPEAGFCLDKSGAFTAVGSLVLPKGYIKGTVGAGDAFCAASLYGIYKGWRDERILEFASAAAACNLGASDSISGMKSREEIEKAFSGCERRKV